MANTAKTETKRRLDIVVECYNKGMTRSDIAEALGRTVKSVDYYIKKAKAMGLISKEVDLRKRKIHFKDDQLIIYLYNSGWSKQKIADRMGVNWVTISRHLKACGIYPKPMRRYDIDFIKKVADAYNYGCDHNEISLRLNITEKQAFYVIQRANEMGLLKPFPGRLTEFRTVADMVKQGFSVKEIAEELEHCQSTIYGCIKTAIQQGLLDPDVHIITGYHKYTKRKGSINK